MSSCLQPVVFIGAIILSLASLSACSGTRPEATSSTALTRAHDQFCPSGYRVLLNPGETAIFPPPPKTLYAPAASGHGGADAEWTFQARVTNNGKVKGSYRYVSGVANVSQFSCPMSPYEGDSYQEPMLVDIAPGFRQAIVAHRDDIVDRASGCFRATNNSITRWLMAPGVAGGSGRVAYPSAIFKVTNTGTTQLTLDNVCFDVETRALF